MNISPDRESRTEVAGESESGNRSSGKVGDPALSRRRFLQRAAQAGATAVVPAGIAVAQAVSAQTANPQARPGSLEGAGQGRVPNPIVPNLRGGFGKFKVPEFQAPKRPMGNTGLQVSVLGMDGYHLGTASGQELVNNMVAKALDHGINFFDNAWEYHSGLSEERVGTALKGKRDQAVVMTKV